MSRMTMTLEVDSPAQEQLVRRYHALLEELDDLGAAAPAGQVFDVLEGAVLDRGRETLRATLEQAVQRQVAAAEKKGRRCGGAGAANSARTAGSAGGGW
jgi:hypothetical protein